MFGLNLKAVMRARRECLRAGSSSLVMGAAASTVMAGEALGFERIEEGRRFVRLDDTNFAINSDTQAALLTFNGGSVEAPEEHYEIVGDDVYVSKEFAVAELALAHQPPQPLFLLPGGLLLNDAAVTVPLLGLSGAALLYLLQPGPLKFTNDGVAVAYENDTPVTYTPVVNRDAGDMLRYSITGNGVDDQLFTIDVSTGRLSFKDPQSFETPEDQNADNRYSVEVSTTDGDETATQTVSISLQDVNEAPSWLSGETATASENDTATSYLAIGSDPDTNASLSFSLTGNGPDDDLFEVDDSTGVLRFRAAANFEAPGDDDGDNQFAIQLAVSDGVKVVRQNVAVTLSDVNEAPLLTSGASGSMAENGTATTYTTTATDVDAGDTQTYSIVVQGADDNFFTIDPSTGAISLVGTLDYENPSDQNGDGDYEFKVMVEDAAGLTDTVDVSMTLTDVNEAPVFENAGPYSVQENATTGTAVGNSNANQGDGGATDVDVTFSITGGTGFGLFDINPNTGEITVSNSGTLDYETTVSYSLEVTATDTTDPTLTTVQTYTVAITDQNEAPAFTSTNTLTIAEGATAPTLQAAVTDPEGDSITWSIVGGADSALFSISGTGELSLNAPEDYESPGDADSDNQHLVTIRADDGNGNQTDQAVSVSITDVNEAPVFSSGGSSLQDENTTTTGYVAAATDPEGAGLTYSIIGTGADDALFNIDPTTGALTFIVAPDAESAGDADGNNAYEVNLRVSDGTNTVDQAVTVNVSNVNEAPAFTSTNTLTIAEGATAPTLQAAVTDPEGDSITWSIVGGADSALFSISGTGELSLNAPEDYESPGDADSDNQHLVTIRADDGNGNQTDQAVSVSITDVNEAPVFSSGGSSLQDENTTTTGYVAAATDPEGAGLTYSIIGTGADDALFNIDPTTGALTFIVAPDAESAGDADGNNAYEVNLRVSDGTNTVDQAVTVNVSNVNEAPAFTSTNTLTIAEGATAPTLQAAVTDPEGDSITWSIVGGADSALFSISGTGELSLNAPEDYESPGDADSDNQHLVTIRADDGNGNQTDQAVSVSITDVNEAPVFSSGGSSLQDENTTTTGYVAAATDPEGAGLTYSIIGTGADDALFNIDPTTGALTFIVAPDAESAGDADGNNAYEVNLRVSDGTNTVDQAVTVNVSNVNEAPAFTSTNTLTIAEGATAPTLQAAVTDPEGDSITWSIVGGADSALFSISGTGELSLNAPEDYESPGDADSDNQHLVTIRADDGNGNQTDQAVSVSITDVNEAPVFSSGGSSLQDENTTTTGYVAAATDPEGAGLTYSIIGTGADDALFNIDPTTGALTFIVAPDAESAGDADGNNAYEVNLRVSDGTNTVDQAVTVNVSNVNEAPTFTSANSDLTLENALATSYVATGTDPESGALSFSLSGAGDDDTLFSIDPSSGALSFLATQDFETPGSFDGDNVFELDVVVSDGALSDNEAVLITVTNANEDPVFAASSTTNVVEDQLDSGFAAVATDVDAGDDQTYSLAAGSGTNDNALFQIAPDSGVLSFLTVPDFETPGSYLSSNTYTVDLVVDDDFGGQDTQTYFIAVTDDGLP